MDFEIQSFRHGEIILNNVISYKKVWEELLDAIRNVTDYEIIQHHESSGRKAKSISHSINYLLKTKLKKLGWNEESCIFQDDEYTGNRWRLDFAKESLSVEVAFNHGEAIAWNLIKPVLAGELNHVKKEVQTDIGIIICATKGLKEKGGFDGAVGEYEKFLTYLNPLRNVLTIPMVIVGLLPMETFEIKVEKIDGKNQGVVYKLGDR